MLCALGRGFHPDPNTIAELAVVDDVVGAAFGCGITNLRRSGNALEPEFERVGESDGCGGVGDAAFGPTGAGVLGSTTGTMAGSDGSSFGRTGSTSGVSSSTLISGALGLPFRSSDSASSFGGGTNALSRAGAVTGSSLPPAGPSTSTWSVLPSSPTLRDDPTAVGATASCCGTGDDSGGGAGGGETVGSGEREWTGGGEGECEVDRDGERDPAGAGDGEGSRLGAAVCATDDDDLRTVVSMIGLAGSAEGVVGCGGGGVRAASGGAVGLGMIVATRLSGGGTGVGATADAEGERAEAGGLEVVTGVGGLLPAVSA